MLEVDKPYVDPDICTNQLGRSEDKTICAGGVVGEDSCNGEFEIKRAMNIYNRNNPTTHDSFVSKVTLVVHSLHLIMYKLELYPLVMDVLPVYLLSTPESGMKIHHLQQQQKSH